MATSTSTVPEVFLDSSIFFITVATPGEVLSNLEDPPPGC